MENKMKKDFQNMFECSVVKNEHPCNSKEELSATIALNEKMKKLQSQFHAKSILSKIAAQEFVVTT